MSFSFKCPECDAVLKLSNPIPPGKKVKCPKCSAVFAAPSSSTSAAPEAVSEKLPPPAVARRPGRDEDDEGPPRRRSRAAERDEEDEVEEQDDEPRGRKRAKKDRKQRSKSSATTTLIALGVLLLLLLGGGGTTAYFVWFYGFNRGTGNEDPIAFVPADTDLVVGIDNAALGNDPMAAQLLQQRNQLQANPLFDRLVKESGLAENELFAEVIVAVKTSPAAGGPPAGFPGGMPGGPPEGMPGGMPAPLGLGPQARTTMIFRSSKPFDPSKVLKATNKPRREKMEGKFYHQITEGEYRTLYMPSNRIIVVSTFTPEEVRSIFKSDGTNPTLPADSAGLIGQVRKNTLWVTVPFQGEIKRQMDQSLARDKPPAELKPLTDALAKSKGVAAWVNLDGDQVKIGVGLVCNDPASAEQVTRSVETIWKQQQGELAKVEFMLLLLPKTGKAYAELKKGLRFAADGNVARVSTEGSRRTFTEAATELGEMARKQAGGGMPGGGMPGGGFPGGMPGGPFGPGGGKGKK